MIGSTTHAYCRPCPPSATCAICGRPAQANLDAIRRFCGERSFDLVHLAGRDLAGVRIYNSPELVTFGSMEKTAAGGADPLRLEAAAVLAGQASPFHGFFNLRPPTLDRPFFTGVLPLARLGTILERVELVPREELAWLVNVAVLVQALVLALVVAALPLFAGVSSWLSQRLAAWPQRGVALAVLGVLAWIALAVAGLDPLLAATAGWPLGSRFLLLLMVIVPLAVALGMPMGALQSAKR